MGFEASLPLLSDGQVQQSIIHIEGMTCNSCVKSIEGNISAIQGIKKITVSLNQKEADVEFCGDTISAEGIAAQIDDMGFEAFVQTINGKTQKKNNISEPLKVIFKRLFTFKFIFKLFSCFYVMAAAAILFTHNIFPVFF